MKGVGDGVVAAVVRVRLGRVARTQNRVFKQRSDRIRFGFFDIISRN